jgi:hypothetical protein
MGGEASWALEGDKKSGFSLDSFWHYPSREEYPILLDEGPNPTQTQGISIGTILGEIVATLPPGEGPRFSLTILWYYSNREGMEA